MPLPTPISYHLKTKNISAFLSLNNFVDSGEQQLLAIKVTLIALKVNKKTSNFLHGT